LGISKPKTKCFNHEKNFYRILLLLTAFSFQCSEPSNEPVQTGMSPALKKALDQLSIKLNAVWITHYRANFSNGKPINLLAASSILNELRAALEPQQQVAFDMVMERPEIQNMIEWSKSQTTSIKIGAGRIGDVWDFETITSAEVQNRITQLHSNIDNTLSGMEGQNKDAIKAAIYTAISDAEFGAYQSTTLTQDEKDAFGSATAMVYDEVGSIVDEFFGPDIPIDQTRMQSWRGFWGKVASVVVFTVACALVAATAGTIIVALGGAALLAEAATIGVGSATFIIVSVSAAMGAGAGLTYGTIMAADNQCFSNGAAPLHSVLYLAKYTCKCDAQSIFDPHFCLF
jgi:hypothetical protein